MTDSEYRIEQALKQGVVQLANSDSPLLDARVLLAFVLCQSTTYLLTWPERLLSEEQYQQYQQMLQRRQAGEPIAYLTGKKEFWSLSFDVSPSTLIPRPDTEVLVEQALEKLTSGQSVLDLGTGTGAIAIAIAHECPDVYVTAVDLRDDALQLARKNVQRHHVHVQLHQSSWFECLQEQKFNLIVSNPPYIDADDPHLQQGDVRFEPHSALIADNQGLADLQTIIIQAPDHLFDDGWLMVEHGYQQAAAVACLMQQAGFDSIHTQYDYAGLARVTMGRYQKRKQDE